MGLTLIIHVLKLCRKLINFEFLINLINILYFITVSLDFIIAIGSIQELDSAFSIDIFINCLKNNT